MGHMTVVRRVFGYRDPKLEDVFCFVIIGEVKEIPHHSIFFRDVEGAQLAINAFRAQGFIVCDETEKDLLQRAKMEINNSLRRKTAKIHRRQELALAASR